MKLNKYTKMPMIYVVHAGYICVAVQMQAAFRKMEEPDR